jgi:hypothetical protein
MSRIRGQMIIMVSDVNSIRCPWASSRSEHFNHKELIQTVWLLQRHKARGTTSVVDPWYFCTDPDPHHWLTDLAPNPAIFVSGWQHANKNKFFFLCLLLFFRNIYISFNRKKSKRSRKIVEIRVFSYFFACLMGGSGSRSVSVENNDGSGSGRPKNLFPADPGPDPQHCVPKQDNNDKKCLYLCSEVKITYGTLRPFWNSSSR